MRYTEELFSLQARVLCMVFSHRDRRAHLSMLMIDVHFFDAGQMKRSF